MPVYDHSKPLKVGVTFYFGTINSFKAVKETISIIPVHFYSIGLTRF